MPANITTTPASPRRLRATTTSTNIPAPSYASSRLPHGPLRVRLSRRTPHIPPHLPWHQVINLFPASPSDLTFPSFPPKDAKKFATDTPTSSGAFQCEVCLKTFTQNRNLEYHLRTLPLGGRSDKLANHMRSKKGQKFLRPLVLERLRDGDGGRDMGGNMFVDQIGGENADALLAAGKGLPLFSDFLKFCGLDKSVIGSGAGVVVVEVTKDGDGSPAERLGGGNITRSKSSWREIHRRSMGGLRCSRAGRAKRSGIEGMCWTYIFEYTNFAVHRTRSGPRYGDYTYAEDLGDGHPWFLFAARVCRPS